MPGPSRDPLQYCCQSQHTFVYILKGLQVGQMHHGEKRLLERVLNLLSLVEQGLESAVQMEWIICRRIDTAADTYWYDAQPTDCRA